MDKYKMGKEDSLRVRKGTGRMLESESDISELEVCISELDDVLITNKVGGPEPELTLCVIPARLSDGSFDPLYSEQFDKAGNYLFEVRRS